MRKLLLGISALMCLHAVAQEAEPKEEQKITFSGFVKNDMFYDTRQMATAREGHFHLYPLNEQLDADGNDINDKSSFNILSFQSRLKAGITGPDAFGAKTSGVIEGAFFGHSNGDENGFRLRHAFGKLKWQSTEFIFGQTWHPMFITACFPGTISFNTGVPFQPFSRNPQLRVNHMLGGITLSLAALSQRDFTSYNADGSASSTALRNAAMPDMQLQLQYASEDKSVVTGFGAGYKTLVPQIATPQEYATDESIGSYSAMLYIKAKLEPVTIKFEAVYGQNMTDLLMLGGYAVADSVYEADSTTKGFVTYTNTNTMSVWTDIHTNGKKYQFGLFAGYTQNMGTDDDVAGKIYARGSNIDYVYRVAPRFVVNSGKMRFAVEPDYTVAAYATEMDSKLVSKKSEEIGNVRLLFSAYYFF